MVLDPIPQPLPVHFFGSRPQPPPSPSNRPLRFWMFTTWLMHMSDVTRSFWNVTFLCVCVCGRRPSSRPLRFFQCSLPSCKHSDRKRRGRGGGGVTGTGGCVENQQECWFLKENSARMCCSMLQHVAVCCYVFLCVADWEIFMSVGFWIKSQWECGAVCLSVS